VRCDLSNPSSGLIARPSGRVNGLSLLHPDANVASSFRVSDGVGHRTRGGLGGDATVGVDGDDPSVAGIQHFGETVPGGVRWRLALLDQPGDSGAGRVTHELLADAGTARGAELVGVIPCADDRG